jgi:hypothetical protein
VETPPATRNQIARSLGELLKNLEKVDAVDCVSLKPRMSRIIPATNNAMPNARFIIFGLSPRQTERLPLMIRTSNTTIAMTSKI